MTEKKDCIKLDGELISAYMVIADNEPIIVMAINIADACEKLEELGVSTYSFTHGKSIDIII